MKWPITFERIAAGMWRVTYRGYIAHRYPNPFTGLHAAWQMYRLDRGERRIKWGEIPGRNGQQGLQVQWAPRRWVLFYRLNDAWIRVVWTRGAAPLDLAAADDMRFEKFAAASRGAGSDLFDDPAATPYRLRTDRGDAPWQTFTWGDGPVPPGPRGEQHIWPESPTDPGGDTTGPEDPGR
ncbi:MAG TPA: hypothetical protein VH092_32700 [Urbifossiella sp.]|nr:hypothetical protein [Urbifossiella sp.]